MKPTQQQLIAEKAELDVRRSGLTAFMVSDEFHHVPIMERHRMVRQHCVMLEYSGILGERIAGFQGPEGNSQLPIADSQAASASSQTE